MQYGIEIFPYQRIGKKNNKKKEVDLQPIFTICFYAMGEFFISRVMMINSMAPFGISLLIVAAIKKDNRVKIAAGLGALVGYSSLYGNIQDLGMYFVVIGSVVAFSYIFEQMKAKNKLIGILLIALLEFLLWRLIFIGESFGMSFLNCITEAACIIPVYYIIDKSIICFEYFKTKHLFTNEEIISMAVTIAFMIAGTWGINIFGISLRNIIAITLVAITGYIKGSSAGTACGITMGIIIGLVSKNMIIFVGIIGICGLVAGVFKDTGKWLTGFAYFVSLVMIKLYSNVGAEFKILEGLISLGLFFIIPTDVYSKIESELDYDKKEELQVEDHVEKIKSLFVEKLESFSDILFNVSETLEKLADNDKLALKNKSSGLIENLADRVCNNCSMNSICWRRESFYTFNAFGELIQNYQEKKYGIPKELEKKCTNRELLIKNADEIVNKYIIDEMWRSRLNEGRGIIAAQISNMANSVAEIINEFNINININSELENDIKRLLNKNNIIYKDIMCFNDKNDRLIIKFKMEACGGAQKCINKILPLINQATHRIMSICNDGCNVDLKNNMCEILFEETPKFHVAAYVSRECKQGEKYNGDSFGCEKLNDGTYMSIISDGMGSGSQAGKESAAAVELIQNFMKAGFNKLTAINTVNSIMSMKFAEDEKFSTVDMSSLNLYTGEIDFIKVGAVSSFIKRSNNIDVIKSKTLPIGVLDKVDVDIVTKEVRNGDIVVMLSDGVLDYNSAVAGKVDWMVDYLKNTKLNDPKEISEEIIEKAKSLSGGKVKDDMTVIVEKIYAL